MAAGVEVQDAPPPPEELELYELAKDLGVPYVGSTLQDMPWILLRAFEIVRAKRALWRGIIERTRIEQFKSSSSQSPAIAV